MDLFPAPALNRQTFASSKLSVVPVRGDAMQPTLRGEWDYVLVAPVHAYEGEGLYVIQDDEGLSLIHI